MLHSLGTARESMPVLPKLEVVLESQGLLMLSEVQCSHSYRLNPNFLVHHPNCMLVRNESSRCPSMSLGEVLYYNMLFQIPLAFFLLEILSHLSKVNLSPANYSDALLNMVWALQNNRHLKSSTDISCMHYVELVQNSYWISPFEDKI